MSDTVMLAIDSSTKSSGVSVWKNGTLDEYKLLDCSDNKNMDSRFKSMSIKLLEELKYYSPAIVYIEETVVGRNMQVQRFLTRLQGVVYAYCILHDCEFNSIRPTEWRHLIGIEQGKKKRDELKQLAIDFVSKEFGITDVNDDVAESICIGQAAVNLFKE